MDRTQWTRRLKPSIHPNNAPPSSRRWWLLNAPPLDDDLRWLPIENARERRAERTRDNDLAVLDLMEVLAQGRLPCIIRSTTTGERKLVASTAWTDQIMLEWWPSYGVRVVHRHQPGDPFPNIVKPFRGWVFYVWQPVLDHIWPPRADSAPVVHD